MNEDIEYGGLLSAHHKISKAQAQQESIETLRAERDSLRKALDDRHAPPDLTWFWEIVDRDGLNNVCSDERGALAELVRYAAERDSLRAKLDRAKEALKPFADAERDEEGQTLVDDFAAYENARAILTELSADAPAQPTQTSDDVRALLDEAIAALEPFDLEAGSYEPDEGDGDDTLWMSASGFLRIKHLRQLRALRAKLRAARNG